MIAAFAQLQSLFEEMDAALDETVHIFLIGGAVMLYHGLKPGTKDVDVVVGSAREFRAVEAALKRIGFAARMPTPEYSRFDLSQILVKEDWRVDVFSRTVCRGFRLSAGMKRRAQSVLQLKRLAVSLCSTTDIFLFKTLTEREGDIADCVSLVTTDIDWGAMLEEIDGQIRSVGQKVWITWIGERMDLLLDRGITIPIMDAVNKLRTTYFEEYERQRASPPRSRKSRQ